VCAKKIVEGTFMCAPSFLVCTRLTTCVCARTRTAYCLDGTLFSSVTETLTGTKY